MTERDTMHDAELARLYREAARDEPPAALDTAIFAAARREAERAAAPRARPGWRRWTLPVSVAALALLSFTLTLLVPREQGRDQAPAVGPGLPPPQSLPSPEAPAAADRAPVAPALRREAKPAPAPEAPAGIRLEEAPRSTVEKRATPPAAEEQEKALRRDRVAPEPKVRSEAAGSPAPGGGPASGAAAGMPAPAPPADERALPGRPGTLSAPATQMPASPPASAVPQPKAEPMREQVQRSPEAWLEQIRTLRREGREREAAEQLAAFRRAHPDYPLPQELRAIRP